MKFEDGIHVINSSIPYLPVSSYGAAPFNTVFAPVANEAYLIPFWVPTPINVSSMFLNITTSSGNLDVGIYDKNGNRVVSKGSTASPGTGRQELTFTQTLLVPRLGPYFAAVAVNNGTIRFAQYNLSTAIFRTLVFATSFALPSSLTLGSPSSRIDNRIAWILKNPDFGVAP
jgi:hypothetical protein